MKHEEVLHALLVEMRHMERLAVCIWICATRGKAKLWRESRGQDGQGLGVGLGLG